jgi:ubiquinone/menaquinone biosynthesis C-methylase UbiE
VDLLQVRSERKKMWNEFWERQASSREIIPIVIRLGRYFFSLIYVKFIKRHYCGSSILEIGCGSAESTLKLASENRNIRKVILLDFAFQSMNVARRRALDNGVYANLLIGDIHFIPLKHNSQEFVWNLGLLEHFRDPTPIVEEMTRVTRKGGKVASIVPYRYAPIFGLAMILKPFTKIYSGLKEFQTWEEAKQLWSPKEYQRKFETLGLKNVKAQAILGTFLLNLGVVGEKKND